MHRTATTTELPGPKCRCSEIWLYHSLHPFSTAIPGTRIDGLGGSSLLNWSSMGSGAQGGALLPPAPRGGPGTLHSQISPHLPCPGRPQPHQDAWPQLTDEARKEVNFQNVNKITCIGECAYNESRRPSHFHVIAKLSSQPSVKDWFCYFL